MSNSLAFLAVFIFPVVSEAATVLITRDHLKVSAVTTLEGVGAPVLYSGRSFMGAISPSGLMSLSSSVSWSEGNSYTAEAHVDFLNPSSLLARTSVFVEGEDNAGVAFDGASHISLIQEFDVTGSGAMIDLFFETFDGGTYANVLLTDLTTGDTYSDVGIALADSHRYRLIAETHTLGGYSSDASFSVAFRETQVIARVPENGPSLTGTGIVLIGILAFARSLKVRAVRATRFI